MSIWYFYDTKENTGQFNMDYDLMLCSEFEKDNIPRLRFYRWKPYALSLGFNQNDNNIIKEKLKEDNIDLVRRPTGGRAVLHSEELTYSVVMESSGLDTSTIYSNVSKAIVCGFHIYDEKLKEVELEKNQVDFSKFYKSPKSIPCFSSSARFEIKLGSKKIVGSAQRSFGKYVLQHGSILCGTFHKNLYKYLRLNEDEIKNIRHELDESTISLGEITGREIDYSRLKECIKSGFKEIFEIDFQDKSFI